MSDNTNRTLIEEHFAAKRVRDEAALRSQMTEGVRWWTPQSTEARGVERPAEGREKVVSLLMSKGFYNVDKRNWTLQHVIVDGDLAAVHATLETETVDTGQPYVNNYTFIFEIKDGKIDQVWEHLDTAYAYARLDG